MVKLPKLYSTAYPGSMSERDDGDFVESTDNDSLAAALLRNLYDMQLSVEDWKDDALRLKAEIARLNHQHANDEAANRMLSDACANLRERTIKECAALFSGGMRNRELYVNDIEETILGLLVK